MALWEKIKVQKFEDAFDVGGHRAHLAARGRALAPLGGRRDGAARGVQPDVEVVAGRVRDLEAEVRRGPGDVPVPERLAQERALQPEELWPRLDALDAAIAAQNVEGALALLAELVPEWQRGD